MNQHTTVRSLLASAALAAAVALAGCNGDNLSPSAKASKPIPEKLLAEISEKDMDKSSPILVRIFKQEAELEVWKQNREGRFALLKTYPICRWSGELGPKIKEGDRQAPEGFYSITPGQMNPQSSYYLSFNMGYPNAFDKALGRTGSQLMVHGDCSSRGCYAMTDEQISEIYSLGRESFFGGQRAFQVQAYPFRMTPQNMAKHRNNPHMPFWKMLKEGYDHFEVTRLEPKVDVCDKRYVFNAEPEDAGRPLSFNAGAKCPAYQVPEEIVAAVQDKTRRDDVQIAELTSRGVATAPVRTGADGGMHPVFASKLGIDNLAKDGGADYAIASYTPAPGTIPPHVNPPRAPAAVEVATPAPEATPAATASAPATTTKSSDSIFGRMARAIGIGGSDNRAAPAPARKPAAAVAAAPKAAPAKPEPKPSAPELRTASPAAPERPPALRETASAFGPSHAPSQAPSSSTIAGAQPVMPSSSFESRWSAFR